MATPLVTAIQKAYPIVTETTLKIVMDDLTISLKKEEFVNTLLEEYKSLLEAEVEDWKTGVTIETDFAGSGSLDEASFIIQDTKTDVGEEQRFAFTGFYPTETDEEKDDDYEIPPQIEQVVSWDELKAWMEYVLLSSGKLQEMLAMEAQVQKEYEKQNEDVHELEEDEERITSVEIGAIAIYPSSSVDYHAMRIENTKDAITIQIAFEDLHELSYFIEYESAPKKVHSVYRHSTDEYLELSWEGTELKITFVDGENTGTVTLGAKEAEILREKIEIIEGNSHLM